MQPFFFGPSKSQLYGVFHDSYGQHSEKRGLILCHPLGGEYMRSHRAFQVLAQKAGENGFPCLRFDYRDTGNSSGDGSFQYGKLREDIHDAICELKDLADVSSVTLIGLRLGASLAYEVACSRDDVKELVLWDPILYGHHYLWAMAQKMAKAGLLTSSECADEVYFNGYPYSNKFRSDLAKMDLFSYSAPELEKCTLISTDGCQLEKFKQHLESFAPCHLIKFNLCFDWLKLDDGGNLIMPSKVLQSIGDSLLRKVH